MSASVQGKCQVCHRLGPASQEDDFLCGECAHPEEIRSFCAGCGQRSTHPLEAVSALFSAYKLDPAFAQPGAVIRLVYCGPDCRSEPSTQVEFYAIAA